MFCKFLPISNYVISHVRNYKRQKAGRGLGTRLIGRGKSLSWKYQQWWSPISRTSPDPLLVGVVWKRDKTYVLHFKLIQKDYLSLWLNTLFVVAKVCLVVGVNWLTFLYVTLWLRLCVCGLSFGLAICSEWPMGEHSTCACMATKNTAKQMCCFACSHCVIT